jgi:hypothetical protein
MILIKVNNEFCDEVAKESKKRKLVVISALPSLIMFLHKECHFSIINFLEKANDFWISNKGGAGNNQNESN